LILPLVHMNWSEEGHLYVQPCSSLLSRQSLILSHLWFRLIHRSPFAALTDPAHLNSVLTHGLLHSFSSLSSMQCCAPSHRVETGVHLLKGL
jgi:hypothetical protein